MIRKMLALLGLVVFLCVFVAVQTGEAGIVKGPESGGTTQAGVTTQPAQTQAGAKKQLWTDPVGAFRPPSEAEKKAMAKNLQMTPEQTSQMQTIDKQYRADVDMLTQQYQKARNDLTVALKDPCPTKERVSSEAQKVSQTHAALLNKEIQHWTSIAAVLTKDQECKFWKMFTQQRIQKGN